MPPLPHPDAEDQPRDVGTAAFRMSAPMPATLTQRADFLSAAKARRQGTAGFLLQARRRGDDGPARIGYTCSKKIGNAVARNRAKRRLRAIAREILPDLAQATANISRHEGMEGHARTADIRLDRFSPRPSRDFRLMMPSPRLLMSLLRGRRF